MNKFLIEHMSVLYGLLCKYTEEVCGSEKLDVMHEVTKIYAMERGHRMALRCLKNGDPLTMENYQIYTELDTSADPSTHEMRIPGIDPYETEIYKCPWHDGRVKHGLGPYGKYYCRGIDFWLVKGFNPELQMDCESNLGDGDEFCFHRWNGFTATEEAWARVNEKRARLFDSCRKDMLYHTAHTYFSAKRSLPNLIGQEDADIVLAKAIAEFGVLYGEEAAQAVLAFDQEDFWNI